MDIFRDFLIDEEYQLRKRFESEENFDDDLRIFKRYITLQKKHIKFLKNGLNGMNYGFFYDGLKEIDKLLDIQFVL